MTREGWRKAGSQPAVLFQFKYHWFCEAALLWEVSFLLLLLSSTEQILRCEACPSPSLCAEGWNCAARPSLAAEL